MHCLTCKLLCFIHLLDKNKQNLKEQKVKLRTLDSYEARQTSKERTKTPRFMLEVHDPAQSFVFRSNTVHELRNQHVSIG